MGDVQTGDGIERVPEEPGSESPLAPLGGEGGSVLRTLGSKREERAKRRKKKKDSYAKYLESDTWHRIRHAVLIRDKWHCCGCDKRAEVVHHIRYPKNLGEEKMEWLYSLCRECHDEIHRLAASMPLRRATRLVLASRTGSVVHLEDDERLSKYATRKRQLRGKSSQKLKKRKPRAIRFSANTRMKKKIELANDELHEVQRRAREARERRRVA